MMTASSFVFEVGLHWILEALGGVGLACAFKLCAHPDCLRGAGPVRRALSSRPGRAALWMTFALASSVATVLLIG